MPLQLVEFIKTPTKEDKDASTIKINKENLDQVLNLCGDRPLCIICICGPSRQGKSFILGHIIRCFDAIQNGNDDWMDWGNPKKPLDKGFKWENAYGPVTQGIWMWEKPFILKSKEGKECAVILIDTQGTYDEFTSNKDMTAIVGLSLLMSSVMIFNFFTNLQEDILSSLGTYIEYGLLALDDSDSDAEKPFQKLKFLIRDWNNPTEFPFGEKGGEKFIQKKLDVKENQPESAQKVRKTIKKCFQEMSCFLMPAIGDKALDKNYDGNIGALNKQFAKNMADFINELSDKELVIKRIVGSEVTAKDLSKYIDMYVETFNSSEIPSAMSMWEATTMVANNNTLEKAKKVYQEKIQKSRRGKKYLNPEAFQEAHKEAEEDAMEFFKKAKKYGDQINSFEESLIHFIENEFKVIEADNLGKRATFLSNAEEEAKETFKDYFTSKFIFDDEDIFWEESCIQMEANIALSNAMDEFKDQLIDETDEDVEKRVNALEKLFNECVDSVKTKNQLYVKNAVEKIEKLVEIGVTTYKEKMKEIVNEMESDNLDHLEENSGMEKERMLEEFDKKDKPGDSEFQTKFRTLLEQRMDKEWENIELQFKSKLNEMTEKAEIQIIKLSKEYKEFLKQATKESMITPGTEEDLNNKHNEWVEDQLQAMEDASGFSKDSAKLEMLREKLKEQLDSNLAEALGVVREHLRKNEEILDEAVKSSGAWYQSEMRRATGKYLLEAELLEKHNDLKEKALEKFKEMAADKGVDTEEFKEQLENLIASHFEEIQRSNEEKEEMELSKAKNEIHRCLESYKKEMKNVVEHLRFENGKAASIQDDHENSKRETEAMLLERCANVDGSKHDELLGELQAGIETAFQEFKKTVEFKELELKSAIRDVLDKARQYYHGEMQKNIDNAVYMEPAKLEELHKRISGTAVRQHERELKEEHKQELRAGLDISYIKYKEENQMRFNSEASEIAIGIDLGTTYCCVGAYFKGQVRIIKNSIGANITPSYLALNDDGTEMIGELAKKGAFKDPENTIYDAKRMIGRKWDDPKLQHDIKFWPFSVVNDGGVPKIQARGKSFYPEQISAKLLKHLKNEAEKELQRDIKKVVITVPAYFTDGQRQATVDAGEIAGFEVLEILNEPTAAALAYKIQKINDDAKKVLIFDCGGGTFDVAVLDMKVDEIKVLAVEGDTHLGGEDFDKSMMEYCAQKFTAEKGIDFFEGKDSLNVPIRTKARQAIRRLQTYSEDRKKDLAQMSKTIVSIDNIKNGEDINVEISRAKFEEINHELFKKTLVIVDRALAAAKVKKEEIDDIVLVGGSTRIPKVQSMLKDHFGGRKALNHTIHPDEAVAYGAAVRAAMLNGAGATSDFNSTRIYDVTPMSMGIEVLGGGLSTIIKKGSNVPSTHQEEYYTTYANQTSVEIKIFQGEERIAVNNEHLGSFMLDGIPPNRARAEKVLVRMEVDKMGVLQVTATSKSSGAENKLTVKADKNRLTDEEKRVLKEEEASQSERQATADDSSADYDYHTDQNDSDDDKSDTYRDIETDSEDEKWDY